MQYGKTEAVYLQKEIKDGIENAIKENPDKYKNLSHFLNVAAIKELRLIEQEKKENGIISTDEKKHKD